MHDPDPSDPATLTATGARRAIAAGTLKPAALWEACRARIAEREPVVRAFTVLGKPAPAGDGLLAGLPIGLKDVLDTAGLPTEYGSPIWAGHQPRASAACVAWARAAGAVVMGKTVTTEFATRVPGPTTNPHDATRTPGGSSSGSAAAVAAGFVPLAFGTQTAGSVIRPAAYCGVVGYKPSFGLIDRHGMKVMSASLDTIGVLARSVADCALLAGAVSGLDLGDPDRATPGPRIGICRSPQWDRAAPETVALFDDLAGRLTRAGATVRPFELEGFEGAEHLHSVIMNHESARAMGWELMRHPDQLSPILRERLAFGLAQPVEEVMVARLQQRAWQDWFSQAMADFDILVTPAAPGEAPVGLANTGDPCFNFVWSLLHVPCVTVPAGAGPAGMPLGVQVVGAFGRDAATLAAAAWVEAAAAR